MSKRVIRNALFMAVATVIMAILLLLYIRNTSPLSMGEAAGGYDDIFTAARAMGRTKNLVYTPDPENAAVYDKLFAEYVKLHDYFGRGANDVMKRLKAIKKAQVQA